MVHANETHALLKQRRGHLAGLGQGCQIRPAGCKRNGAPNILPQQLQQRVMAAKSAATGIERHIYQLQAKGVQVCVHALPLRDHERDDKLQQIQEGLQSHLCADGSVQALWICNTAHAGSASILAIGHLARS